MNMDLRQPPIAAFTRFLKDSTRRKSTFSPPSRPASSVGNRENESTTIFSRRPSKDDRNDRRSSTAQFTDKMRQMLTLSHRVSTGVNDLPVEVLHCMFLHLDFWTLLRCQRVCRLWRDLIPGDSPLLAEVLYLKPSKSLQIYSSVPATFDFDFDIVPQVIPRQMKAGPVILGEQHEFTMARRCIGLIRTSSEIVFHPVVANFDCYMQDEVFTDGLGETGAIEGAWGSWTKMLVSMPPLRELRLRHGKKRSVFRVLTVREGEEGIMLGDLVKTIFDWAESLTDAE